MKPVKLLLTENVDNLGIVGDVVTVKPGFARNYLLPMGKATEPTQGNVAKLAEKRKEVEAQLAQERAQHVALLEKIEGLELTIMRSANDQGILYGGVSQHDIAMALQEEGFDIGDRAVRVGERVERLDTYNIPIVLDDDLKTEIKLWVVSDKPRDELADQDEESGDDGPLEGEAAVENASV